MDVLAIEATQDEWCVERSDKDGKVLGTETGNLGVQNPTRLKDDKFIVVVWQSERVLDVVGRDCVREIAKTRAVIDLYQLAWLLVLAGVLKERTLGGLAKWCNVSLQPEASCGERCRAVADCYRRLAYRANLAFGIEDVGRGVATKVMDRAMEAVGKLVK